MAGITAEEVGPKADEFLILAETRLTSSNKDERHAHSEKELTAGLKLIAPFKFPPPSEDIVVKVVILKRYTFVALKKPRTAATMVGFIFKKGVSPLPSVTEKVAVARKTATALSSGDPSLSENTGDIAATRGRAACERPLRAFLGACAVDRAPLFDFGGIIEYNER